MLDAMGFTGHNPTAVSYTHLDVDKRQLRATDTITMKPEK